MLLRHLLNGTPLIAAVIALSAACQGDAEIPQTPTEPDVAVETDSEPDVIPDPPEPVPEPPRQAEGATLIELVETEAPTPRIQRPDSDSLSLTPAFRPGNTFRRQVDWNSITEIRIGAGVGIASSLVDASVQATYGLRITGVEKGVPTTIEVRFDSFTRHAAGRPTALGTDPASGQVWSCRTDATPARCANAAGEIFNAPPWLALTYTPLMPARFIRPAETWSRRIGVAPTLGLPSTATARATLQAEAPYQHGDDLLSTVTVEFDADVLVEAFGRPIRMRGEGTAAMEIDLGRRRLVALDSEWSGAARARGHSTDGALDFERQTSMTLRVTELAGD